MSKAVETTGIPASLEDAVNSRILEVITLAGPNWDLLAAVKSHIMVQLNEPRPGQKTKDWERTCDGCDRLLGKRERAWWGEATVLMDDGVTFHITFLFCQLCADQVEHT